MLRTEARRDFIFNCKDFKKARAVRQILHFLFFFFLFFFVLFFNSTSFHNKHAAGLVKHIGGL